MVNDKILYERTGFIVHEPSATHEARTGLPREIRGRMKILDNEHRKCFQFIPVNLENSMTEDWALIQDSHSVVSYKSNGQDSASIQPNPLLNYRYFFNLNELQSVRRYRSMQDIGRITFTLKDRRTLPTFYFNAGGSRELLDTLRQLVPLTQ